MFCFWFVFLNGLNEGPARGESPWSCRSPWGAAEPCLQIPCKTRDGGNFIPGRHTAGVTLHFSFVSTRWRPLHYRRDTWLNKCVHGKSKTAVPVAQVTLEGEQVLVEALDGLLLQDVVDAVAPVQHPDLHLGLLLPRGGFHALRQLVFCN